MRKIQQQVNSDYAQSKNENTETNRTKDRSFILANLRIFFEIWLQQFFCIFNVSFSRACNRETQPNQLRCLFVFVVATVCVCVHMRLVAHQV